MLWHTDFDPLDREWLSTLKDDRRLVEVLDAFDQLITKGCSAKEHAILVSLVIDDLSHNAGTEYDGYYTPQRKHQLAKVRDPALRLLAARAAGIPFSGAVPSPNSQEWSEEAWVMAISFWCSSYQECDLYTDEILLGSAVESNPELTALIIKTSSSNPGLQVSGLLFSKIHTHPSTELASESAAVNCAPV